MRYFILLLSILMFLSCESRQVSNVKDKICKSQVEIGTGSICLIDMEGMKEVYSDPNVKKHIDNSEPSVLQVLGVYLTDDKYSSIKVENGDIINNQEVFTDRFKLYIAKNMINSTQNEKELEAFYNRTKQTISKPKEVKDLLNNEFKDVVYNEPQFIKYYKLDNNAYSFVSLLRIFVPETNQEFVKVSIITMMNINGKAVNSNYITEFVDEKTIDLAIAKNEIFTTKLLELNN